MRNAPKSRRFRNRWFLVGRTPAAHRLAEPIPGADSDRICALARRYGLTISIGLDEKDGERLYDSAILVDRDGQILWKHRKLNVLAELMDLPYTEGMLEGIDVVQTEYGRIGTLICADTFIDAYAESIGSLKPDLMLIPYGWAAEVDKWPGHAGELARIVSGRARMWGCPIGTDRGRDDARPLERADVRRRQRRGRPIWTTRRNTARSRC